MAKRSAGGTGMTRTEKLLGGAVLAVYLFVLPLTAQALLNGAEKLLGVSMDRSLRDTVYYCILFALVLIAFWGYLGRTTRAFLDHPWRVLGTAGAGLVAFYGLNELMARVLWLLRLGQTNLNDQAILARLASAPGSTVLIVVFLAPLVEELLFRGYVFGNLKEYSRAAAYLASCLLFALLHVWQYAAAAWDFGYLLAAVQYLVPGLVLAWTYERSGSLWGSVLLHCAVNGLAVWGAM